LSSQTNGITVEPKERVFLSLKKAMMDVSVDATSFSPCSLMPIFQGDAYPSPASVVLNRTKEQKLLLGDGCVKLLGEDYIRDVRYFCSGLIHN
jgi:hypothetical protein